MKTKISKHYRNIIGSMVLALFVLTAGGVFDAFSGFLRTGGLGQLIAASDPNTIKYGYGFGDNGRGYGEGYGYDGSEAMNNTNTRYADGTMDEIGLIMDGSSTTVGDQTIVGQSNISVTIPSGTTITTSLGVPVGSNVTFPIPVWSTNYSLGSNQTARGVVELDFGGHVNFSQPIRVVIPVPTGLSTVRVGVNHGGGIVFAGLTTNASAVCSNGMVVAPNAYNGTNITVVNNTVTIYTCGASTFVAYTETSGGGGGGGGGGSYIVTTDSCPNGDTSGSNTDGKCSPTSTGSVATGATTPIIVNYLKFPLEWNDAYRFAFQHGITTMPSIQEANMTGTMSRAHLAKMMANYAIHVLGKTPDTTRECKFVDITIENAELRSYIRLACQLGIMGVDTREFQPRVKVTRAQFGTVLSRALWGDKYNTDVPTYLHHLVPYYTYHLNELKKAGIIQVNDPKIVELRSYVMLMLMRAKLGTNTSYDYAVKTGSVAGTPSGGSSTDTSVMPVNSSFSQKEIDIIKKFDRNYQFVISYSKGQAEVGVKYLQYFLRVHNYYKGQIHGINTTETIEAVYKFQVDRGLMSKASDPGAGLLGPKTRAVINPMLRELLYTNIYQ